MEKIDPESRGQTLIEAMIALASILLTLTAISVAIITSVSNSQFIKNQTLASKYAQAGIELMRNYRNTDPPGFDGREGVYCLGEGNALSETPGACNPQTDPYIDGVFKREVEFTKNALVDCDGGTRVSVSVYWQSGKCDSSNTFCHRSHLVSCFSNIPSSSVQL
jgi:Tfp pilus assembly protein PilV